MAVLSLGAAVVAIGGDGRRPVGTHIPGDEPAAPGYPATGIPETVLATGSSPIAGRWQISEYASQAIVDKGELVQGVVGNGPGGRPAGDLEVLSLPVPDASGKVEVILWGRVAEGTGAIELSAAGASPMHVAPEAGPADFAGDVWAIATSPDVEKASVSRLDNQHRRIGLPVDATEDMARARRFAK